MLRRLKHEVRTVMQSRGHKVGQFKRLTSIWDLECRWCTLGGSVLLEPQPNQIQTFGAGLALNCTWLAEGTSISPELMSQRGR